MTRVNIQETDMVQLKVTNVTDPALNAAVSTTIIDAYSWVLITTTGASNAQTLQTPTVTTDIKRFNIINNDTSTNSITINGIVLWAWENINFTRDGSAWTELNNWTTWVTSWGALTDNAIVRWDGWALWVQTSSVLIDDSDNITWFTSLATTNTTIADREITSATWWVLNIALSWAAWDDFTVDTNKLVVEWDTWFVWMWVVPTVALDIENTGATLLKLNRTGSVSNNTIQLMNDDGSIFFWLTTNEGFGIWTSADLIWTGFFTVASNSDTGIGISLPSTPLHIYRNDTVTGTAGWILIEQDGTGDSQIQFLLTGIQRWYAGVDNSDNYKFEISPSSLWSGIWLTIDIAWNTWIWTTAPAELLEIEDALATTTLQISNSAADWDPQLAFALSWTKTFTMWVDDWDWDKFKIGTTAIGTSTFMTIDPATSNIWIWTDAPNADFEVVWDIRLSKSISFGANPIADGVIDLTSATIYNPASTDEKDIIHKTSWPEIAISTRGGLNVYWDTNNNGSTTSVIFGISEWDTSGGSPNSLFKVLKNWNVGIGIAVPTTALNIYRNNSLVGSQVRIEQDGTGDADLSFVLTGSLAWMMGIDNSDSDTFKIGNSNADLGTSNKFSITTIGNIWIGTAAPDELLEIEDALATTTLQISNSAADWDPQLAFALSWTKVFTMWVDDWDSDKFKIWTTAIGTSTFMTIDPATGNVWIGTTAPDTKIDIRTSDATALGILTARNASDVTQIFNESDTADYTGISFLTRTTNAAIGRMAQEFTGTGKGDFVFLLRDGGSTVDEKFRIMSTGNVWIWIATPTAKTHIDQSSTSWAIPVLRLDQGDIDDTFIDFIWTSAADWTRSISSDTTEDSAKFWAIRVEINWVTKWIRIYDDES